jgi:LmbE family N-acetylglucosaminyl deacetylase
MSPSSKLHLLAIGAHIGDAEITAGLPVAKYAAAGHRTTLLHLTAGERGNPRMSAADYRQQRMREARAAAEKLGAQECIVWDHPDGELQADRATIEQMCDLIRNLRPDIVLTHWRDSFHRDHRAAYQITMEGAFLAALPDVPAVLGIWNRALTRDPISEERFVHVVLADADYWQGPDSGFFVAELNDRPAGFLRAIIRRQPNDRLGLEPEDGWIPYFAVDPDLQRRGVGAALLDAASDWLRGQGRQRIWVCGTPTSAPGSTGWARRGLLPVERRALRTVRGGP